MTELFHGTWWDLHKNEQPGEVFNGRFTQLFPRLKAAHFDEAHLLGLPLPWLLLGVLVYPAMLGLGWFYVRQAERNEHDFTDLVDRP